MPNLMPNPDTLDSQINAAQTPHNSQEITTLLKSNLVERLAHKCHIDQVSTDKAIKLLLQCITDNLSAGNRIEIRKFGSFELRVRNNQTARNPKNGNIVSIDKLYTIHFKPGKPLRDTVNPYHKIDPVLSKKLKNIQKRTQTESI